MQTNAFTWVLLAFPAYLVLSGRLTTYFGMAAIDGASKKAVANSTMGKLADMLPTLPGQRIIFDSVIGAITKPNNGDTAP